MIRISYHEGSKRVRTIHVESSYVYWYSFKGYMLTISLLYIQSSDHTMFEPRRGKSFFKWNIRPAARRTILACPISKTRCSSSVGSNVSGTEIELTSGTIFREETVIKILLRPFFDNFYRFQWISYQLIAKEFTLSVCQLPSECLPRTKLSGHDIRCLP